MALLEDTPLLTPSYWSVNGQLESATSAFGNLECSQVDPTYDLHMRCDDDSNHQMLMKIHQRVDSTQMIDGFETLFM